jgi:mitogen-activated protein kinase kinase
MKRKNVKGLALNAAPKPPPETGRRDGKDESQQLEIGIEYKLDLRQEDLETIKELGSGNGGTVSKVKHVTTGTVMARKVRIQRASASPWASSFPLPSLRGLSSR